MKLNDTVWNAVLCAAATGILYVASRDIAPYGPLVLLAPIPVLLYALSSDRLWRVVFTAAAARAIGAAALIYTYWGTLPLGVLALGTVAASAEFAIVIMLTRLAVGRLPLWAGVLSFPVFATAAEFLAQIGSPHGSFGALGYALIDVRALVQVASLGGIAAVTFIAALVPMTLALLVHTPARWRVVLATGATPVILACLFGIWRLSLPYEGHTKVALASIDSLTLRALQGPDEATHVAASYAAVVRNFEGQQLEAIVLPERIFVDATETPADASVRLQDAANRLGVRIIAGFDEAFEGDRHGNTARIFTPHSPLQTYVKRKLIPGLESQLAPGDESLLIGDRGVAICKDLDFAPMIREYGQRGVALLFVPAWDFTLDGRMHARMAVLRGIENGFALARAAATGRLTVSDAYGRIVAETTTSANAPVTLIAEVGLTSTRTLYSLIGDVFAWFTVGVALTLLVWSAFCTSRTQRGSR